MQDKETATLNNLLFYLIFLFYWISFFLLLADAISCYSCNSVNGSNQPCEDPMDGSVGVEKPCMQGISDHKGLFFARFCLKIKGRRQSDGQLLVMRRCSMEKLADIMTHCGEFKLNEDLYSGCIATCNKDWCNAAPPTSSPTARGMVPLALASLAFHFVA
ncbi:unnamed protein product [Protopolystoma xenopodis]|uniref:Protein sleepless n=1 Tax=Protopolystoma xenopodis TaxID=117903 RepID=A0A3S5BZ36_9PLAT|nr:unnamed protein product [Protopolystoma xenopodis]